MARRQRALVTGGSSGVGAEIARMLARTGRDVAIVGRRERELRTVADAVERLGAAGTVVCADLAIPAEQDRVAELAVGVDVLVNCAASVGTVGDVLDAIDPVCWRRDFEVNVHAPYRLSAAVLPSMRRQGYGRIVSIASVAALRAPASPGWSAYSATKHALRVVTEAIQTENADHGVLAWAICPGAIDAPLAGVAPGWADARRELALRTSDIAEMVEFLLSLDRRVAPGPVIEIWPARNPLFSPPRDE